VEPSFPLFLFAPPGETWPVMKDIAARMRQLKAETLLITDVSNREVDGRAIVIPARPRAPKASPRDLFTPIPYIVPAQLFAARLAHEKGIDPDRPRSLSKITTNL
jgi:glutamine---fructose-6-phosphate transaminase (isomerizing)